MKKRWLVLSCVLMLVFLPHCKPVIKKEDVFLQSSQIKAAMRLSPAQPVAKTENAFLIQAVPAIESALAQEETLVYKIKFLGLSLGKFILINRGIRMLDGRPAYRFELAVSTVPLFAKLFKTKDRYVSYMDPHKFAVLRHEEYIKDGEQMESVVDFDYDRHLAFYKNLITGREASVAIPDRVIDVISGGYYLRTIPWQLGDTVDLKVYADEKVYDFLGFYRSQITVNLPPHGKQKVDVFIPYLFLNDQPIKEISAEVLFSQTLPRKSMKAVLKTPVASVSVLLE